MSNGHYDDFSGVLACEYGSERTVTLKLDHKNLLC
ncbi:hypothetical protein HP15_p187g165 (plasmid) [Marinobacter adhaerens HP15]|uniref:Uncharacterized protein n=1 Tax=Marinobacter adhaerens (strain DSM 23420 / HP15) TaxID=225937 RepID=E4PSC7_MARAH|nr:hypothetical protein HP15_p187g165 [Marinobacter adhaerens HP15]